MPPSKALDDSALGRFQNLNAAPGSGVDPNTLSYHARSDSSSSGPSAASPTPHSASELIPQDETGEVPRTVGLLHNDEDDLASTVSGMSDFASLHNENKQTSELEHLKLSATGPELEYRYIRSSDTYGRAPFTKPHFISNSTSPPFSGPHTAISIPFGPDFGKYMHIPRALRATELGLAELAIFWLWSGLRRNEGSGRTMTTTSGPVISPTLLARHKTGPPAAPFAMTESTFPAFVGPRTCILNTGFVLNGWLLQVPRYLSNEEMAVASENLAQIADKISSWSVYADPSCRLGLKRSEEEQADLMGFMAQQKEDMTLLEDVVGLDFAAQDDGESTCMPIWVRRDAEDRAVETPRKRTMLPTPPSTGERRRLQSKAADADLIDVHVASPSGQDLRLANPATPHADLARAARNPLSTAAHIQAWSRDVAAFPAKLDIHERTAHPRLSKAEDDGIEVDTSHSSRSDYRPPAPGALSAQVGTVDPTTSRGRRSTADAVKSEDIQHFADRCEAVAVPKAALTYHFISTLPICDIILVTFCSLILCWLVVMEFI